MVVECPSDGGTEVVSLGVEDRGPVALLGGEEVAARLGCCGRCPGGVTLVEGVVLIGSVQLVEGVLPNRFEHPVSIGVR